MWLSVHVGHGKTGSSFLQAWLACNAEVLQREHGILYPLQAPCSGQCDQEAAQGRFSMGNGFVLEEILAAPQPQLLLRQLAAGLPADGQLLFSCERFIRSLTPQLEWLQTLALAAGLEGVRLLLFVRDPLEHAHSLYAEMVKAHGFTGSVEAWLELYNLHQAVATFLSTVQGVGATQLTVFNYSLAPGALRQQLAAWLGLPLHADQPAGALQEPPVAQVNRSLDAAELEALLVLNRLLGAAAQPLGRGLVNGLPQWPVRRVLAGPEAQQAFLERLAPPVAAINALLPPDQALRLRLEPPAAAAAAAPTGICLAPQQLELLARGLLELGRQGQPAS